MITRFGTCRPDRKYRLRPGAYALLPHGNRILMTVRPTPEPDFQLPGGGIEIGESILCGLHRETLEETGWRIQPLHHIATFRRHAWLPDYGFWAEKLCHVWLARPVMKLGEASEPGHSAVWLPLDGVVGRMADPGARAVVDSYLRRCARAHGRRSIRTADMSSRRRPCV